MPPQVFSRPTDTGHRLRSLCVTRVPVWRNPATKRSGRRIVLNFLVPIIAVVFLLTMFAGCRKKASAPTTAPNAISAVETEPTPKPKVDSESIASPEKPKEAAPERPAKVEPPAKPEPSPAPISFEPCEASFVARKYTDATKCFDDYLKKNPKSSKRDFVLFRLGVSYALIANSPGGNMLKAEDLMRKSEYFLKLLVQDFPASPYRGPADLILSLQSQVKSLKADLAEKETKLKQLGDELQKLKEIDLQRRPSRSSY